MLVTPSCIWKLDSDFGVQAMARVAYSVYIPTRGISLLAENYRFATIYSHQNF